MMPRRPRATLAFTILAGAVLPAAAMAAPASKTFRNWIAACDNLQGCTALSLPAEAVDPVAFLRLERPGGPSGAPKLTLRIGGEALKAPLAAQLSLDGAPFPGPGKTLPVTIVDSEQASVVIPAADAEALIAAARKAAKLGVSLAGKRYEVSLAGSVAAMLWIDEQQGRLNTTTALIRRGPANNVPSAPILPLILAQPTQALPAIDAKTAKAVTTALRRQLKKTDPDACDDDEGAPPDADSVWPLTGTLRLIGLSCSRGAYNVTTGFWTVTGNDMAKARKVAFPRIGEASDNMLVNAEYDPRTGQIAYFGKGRGLSDCGTAGGYAWTGTGFVMTTLSEMGECRMIGPDDWPVLFQSDVKVGQ